MLKKCKKTGCFEPADCWHGLCHAHCRSRNHQEQAYSARTYPKTAEPHLGVEIEVEYLSETDKKRGLAVSRGHSDGSLQCGAEYKLLAPTRRAWKKCHTVLEKLWERRATVSKRCGLHVHIDIRKVSYERLDKAWAWLYATQEVWFNLMPHSRRDNHYCRRVSSHRTSDHFAWVHTTGYQTLEVRLHGGTLNPFKVRAWLAVMAHLQNKMIDETYTFPTMPICDSPDSIQQAREDMFNSFFADASKEAKEYLLTRKVNGGVINDYAFRHLENGEANAAR